MIKQSHNRILKLLELKLKVLLWVSLVPSFMLLVAAILLQVRMVRNLLIYLMTQLYSIIYKLVA